MNDLHDRLLARVAEIKAQEAAKDFDLEDLRGKVDNIRTMVENLGTVPTLSKLRDFLSAIKTLMQEATRG